MSTGPATTDLLSSTNTDLLAASPPETLYGNGGSNVFYVNNSATTIIESNYYNNDIVYSSVSYTLPNFVNTLTLTGSADLTATGNSGYDLITANSGNDTLISGTGVDTLVGGIGNDTFVVNNYSDIVTAQAGSQNTLITGTYYPGMPVNVQTMVLTGSLNLAAYGNSQNDTIFANSGNDTLVGGSANNIFHVGAGADQVQGGGGTNTVVFSGDLANYQITTAPWSGIFQVADTTHHDGTASLYNVQVAQFADASVNLIDYSPSYGTVSGGTGDNFIITDRGNDLVIGGTGNDTFVVGGGNDTIQGGGGHDTVVFSGNEANYQIAQTATGWTVTDTTGAQGTNILSNISTLQFADHTISLQPQAPGAPTLTLQAASGNEGQPIALNIAAALAQDGLPDALSVTISNVPSGATLSAGTSDGHGNWVLTAAQLQGLTLTPAAPIAGDLALQVTAVATDTADGASTSTTAALDVHVAPEAQAPTLVLQAASGNEGSAIALNIASSLVADGGSEALSITVSNVPSGATLSAGTSDGHGNWVLTAAQLQGLTLTPAAPLAGDLALQVTATATEAANNSTASTTATLDVHVAPEAQAPTLSVQAASGNEGSPIALNIASGLVADGGSEQLSITVSNVPTGATLSAGTSDGHGDWVLTPAQLQGLTLTPATGFSGELALQVMATATEAANHSTASTTASLNVNVLDPPPPVTDPPPSATTLTTSALSTELPNAYQTLVLTGSADLYISGNDLGDTIYANSGNDTLAGGAGNDTFHVGAGADQINGGGGTNTVVFSGDLANYQITAAPWSGVFQVADTTHHDGTASLTNIQVAQFADASVNLIDYSSSYSTVSGEATGDNFILTDRGNDIVTGGTGNDTFVVGGGSDTIHGGTGHDTVVFSGNEANYQITQTATGWTVTDTVGTQGTNVLSNITTLQFADHSYTLPTTPYTGPATPPPTTGSTPPVTSSGGATPPAVSGTITPPSVEQPTHPGDIVGVQIDNTGTAATASQVYTFGELFKQGDLPAGDHLIAVVNGQDIPIQMDVKTTHADGSVNDAILSVQLPATVAGGDVNIMLARSSAPVTAAPALDPASLLTHGYDVSVNVDIHNADGTLSDYTVNAAQVLSQALHDGTAQTWLSGPLATEVRVVDNITSTLHATFDIRTMADGQVHTDVSFGYDGAYTVNNSNLTYDVSIDNNGQTVFSQNDLTQYQHTNWHEEVWSGGSAPTLNTVYDIPYMVGTGDIPQIDTSQQVNAATVAANYEALTPANTGPMGTALLTTYMPTTGQTDSDTVGLMTNWETDWLLSQSPQAKAVMLATANAAGTIPWHFMDESTGQPLTITDHPGVRTSTNGPGTGTDALPYTWDPSDTPWTPDAAHQPDLAYLAYLTTGSHYYLDELQYQAAFDLSFYSPYYRGGAEGLINTGSGEQVREEAWDYRTIADAANASPDGSALKAYFQTELTNNLNYEFQNYITDNNHGAAGQVEGWIQGDNRVETQVAPWQEDFLTMTYGYLAQLGVPHASDMLAYMENFEAGRYLNGANGFNPVFGSAYELNVMDPTTGQPFSTWAQVFTSTFGTETAPTNFMDTGNPASAGAYWGSARGALATEITGTLSPDAIAAYGYVVHFTENTGLVQDYANSPKFEIAPKLGNGQYLLNSNIQVDYSSNNITMTATPGQNSLLYAGSGNDILQGGSGDDLLFGGSGHDTLIAGTGDDFIFAGSGQTTIVDGTGNDYMNAGTGADTFVFAENNSGHDTIAGFKVGVDMIEVAANLNSNGITTAAQLLATVTTDAAGDAVLHLGANDDIVLLGITPAHLTVSSIAMH